MGDNEQQQVAQDKSDAPRILTLAEVSAHTKSDSCWVVIHDKVYDVTKFLDEHPGGEEVLLEQAGANSTESFEDVGHSTDAREMMKEYYIGELAEEDRLHTKDRGPKAWSGSSSSGENSWASWLLPMGLACVASLIYRMYALPQAG